MAVKEPFLVKVILTTRVKILAPFQRIFGKKSTECA